MNTSNAPLDERGWIKELVSSREHIFKQLLDMLSEQDKPYRWEAIKWIYENNKWPGRYRFKIKGRWYNKTTTEIRYGWYMSSNPTSNTMEQVAEKGSSTIPYELRNWNYTGNDLKQWYQEEDALEWLINQIEHMLRKKAESEERKKLQEASAGNAFPIED